MRYPKISIVTPSFNCQSLIEQTIRSLLDQNYPNLQLIIIDGGSTDGTQEVIQKYSDQLYYWHSKPDQGQYDAINQGFARSTGEIMAWLNADDMLLPKSLFVVSEIFQQLDQVDWISSLQPASFDATGYLAQVNKLPGFSKQAFLDGLYLPTTAKKGYWLQQESTFWRRSLWEKTGSSIPEYSLAGDFALWCKFYEVANLYGVCYPLGGFRMIEGQRSEDHQNYLLQATSALEKLRLGANWISGATNPLIYNPFSQIKGIQQFAKNRYGYQGSFIQKQYPRKSDARWSVNDQKFLP